MISKQILAGHYDTYRFHGKPPLHALLATLRDFIICILRPHLRALRYWAGKQFIRYRSKIFPFIHSVGDGRGLRIVCVDGVERRRVVHANTLTGAVVHNGDELELHPARKDTVKTYKLRGKVTIKWLKP